MGIIIEFPTEAAARRVGLAGTAQVGPATVLILPAIRIAYGVDAPGDDLGPQTGAASGRRQRPGRS